MENIYIYKSEKNLYSIPFFLLILTFPGVYLVATGEIFYGCFIILVFAFFLFLSIKYVYKKIKNRKPEIEINDNGFILNEETSAYQKNKENITNACSLSGFQAFDDIAYFNPNDKSLIRDFIDETFKNKNYVSSQNQIIAYIVTSKAVSLYRNFSPSYIEIEYKQEDEGQMAEDGYYYEPEQNTKKTNVIFYANGLAVSTKNLILLLNFKLKQYKNIQRGNDVKVIESIVDSQKNKLGLNAFYRNGFARVLLCALIFLVLFQGFYLFRKSEIQPLTDLAQFGESRYDKKENLKGNDNYDVFLKREYAKAACDAEDKSEPDSLTEEEMIRKLAIEMVMQQNGRSYGEKHSSEHYEINKMSGAQAQAYADSLIKKKQLNGKDVNNLKLKAEQAAQIKMNKYLNSLSYFRRQAFDEERTMFVIITLAAMFICWFIRKITKSYSKDILK